MPITKVTYRGYSGNEVTEPVDVVLEKAYDDPFFPWPYPVLKTMLRGSPRLKTPEEGISVTTLTTKCVRCAVIMEREPYTVRLANNWSRWRGTMLHGVMESGAPNNAFAEVRFFASYNGIVVHGQVDELLVRKGGAAIIRDWKFPTKLPKWDKVWDDHNEQVQKYRWCVNHATSWTPAHANFGGYHPSELEFEKVGVVYLGPDDIKPLECRKTIYVQTKSGAKNPTKPVKVSDIWTDEQVESVMDPQIDRILSAFDQYDKDGTLPPYEEDFDYIGKTGLHAYSDVATTCIQRHIEGR